jgi:hypothetical protein
MAAVLSNSLPMGPSRWRARLHRDELLTCMTYVRIACKLLTWSTIREHYGLNRTNGAKVRTPVGTLGIRNIYAPGEPIAMSYYKGYRYKRGKIYTIE